jgi:hypothetical protein
MTTDHTKRTPQARSLDGLSPTGVYAIRCARRGYFVIPIHSMKEGECSCTAWQKCHGR